MKKFFLTLVFLVFTAFAYLSITPTDVKAGSFECYDYGDPTTGCGESSLENCFCDPVVIYG